MTNIAKLFTLAGVSAKRASRSGRKSGQFDHRLYLDALALQRRQFTLTEIAGMLNADRATIINLLYTQLERKYD